MRRSTFSLAFPRNLRASNSKWRAANCELSWSWLSVQAGRDKEGEMRRKWAAPRVDGQQADNSGVDGVGVPSSASAADE